MLLLRPKWALQVNAFDNVDCDLDAVPQHNESRVASTTPRDNCITTSQVSTRTKKKRIQPMVEDHGGVPVVTLVGTEGSDKNARAAAFEADTEDEDENEDEDEVERVKERTADPSPPVASSPSVDCSILPQSPRLTCMIVHGTEPPVSVIWEKAESMKDRGGPEE